MLRAGCFAERGRITGARHLLRKQPDRIVRRASRMVGGLTAPLTEHGRHRIKASLSKWRDGRGFLAIGGLYGRMVK
jgi:hypothetical protein